MAVNFIRLIARHICTCDMNLVYCHPIWFMYVKIVLGRVIWFKDVDVMMNYKPKNWILWFYPYLNLWIYWAKKKRVERQKRKDIADPDLQNWIDNIFSFPSYKLALYSCNVKSDQHYFLCSRLKAIFKNLGFFFKKNSFLLLVYNSPLFVYK